MKKMRYIPIIGLAALLSSCSLFGGVKAPKFAKEGDEVKYDKFVEKFADASEDSELADYDSKLSDRIIKGNSSYSQTLSVKRGKKEIRKQTSTYVLKGEDQYDTDSLVAKLTSEIKYTTKETNEEGSSNESSTAKRESYYQYGKIDGEKKQINANAKTKTYSCSQLYGEEADAFDSLIRSDITSSFYTFSSSMPGTEEAAKDYNFYINDTIFTVSYIDEDDDKTDNYKVTTTIKLKAQIDIKDGKQAFRYSREQKVVTTYTKDYNGYKEDDVVTEETKTYGETTVNSKDVKLKEVNLDDYAKA